MKIYFTHGNKYKKTLWQHLVKNVPLNQIMKSRYFVGVRNRNLLMCLVYFEHAAQNADLGVVQNLGVFRLSKSLQQWMKSNNGNN